MRADLSAPASLASPGPTPFHHNDGNRHQCSQRVHPSDLPDGVRPQPDQRDRGEPRARGRLSRIRRQCGIIHLPRVSALHPRQHRHGNQRQHRYSNPQITGLHGSSATQPGNSDNHKCKNKQQHGRALIRVRFWQRRTRQELQQHHACREQFNQAVGSERQQSDTMRLRRRPQRRPAFESHPRNRDPLKPRNRSRHFWFVSAGSAAAIIAPHLTAHPVNAAPAGRPAVSALETRSSPAVPGSPRPSRRWCCPR